jgi:threonine synthase
MKERMFKQRVGRTPLVRARGLEGELGIERIHLKLEGNNPTGHRVDRLAYLLIRDALSRGKHTLCLAGYGAIAGSLRQFGRAFDVTCVFYIPEGSRLFSDEVERGEGVLVREHGRTFEASIEESRRVARKRGWYNANFGLANSMINMYAFSDIAAELTEQLQGRVDTVLCQTADGSAVSGLHLGFREQWMQERLKRPPALWAVSTSAGNAIVESFRRNSPEILTLEQERPATTRYGRRLVSAVCQNGQDALNAIYDTGGRALGMSDQEVLASVERTRDLEKIMLTLENAFPVAGLVTAAERGELGPGDHVLILDDGKVDLEIRALGLDDLNMPYGKLLERLDGWLGEFTDPLEEIDEAVRQAFEKGFVLGAFDGSTLRGLTVLVNTGFEVFIPQYHMAYIATEKSAKGMGIATQLIQEAIERSGGSLSLHVDSGNKKAIRLYEKMGLRRKYARMLYVGGEGGT